MTAVVHLRGTSGSGKSTIVYRLLKDPLLMFAEEQAKPLDPKAGERMTILGYASMAHPLAIVGPYKTPCGGCDAVKTQDDICLRVKRYAVALQRNTIFEGLLASGLFSRYRDLAFDLARQGVTYYSCVLPTSLETCLERTQARRAARGDGRPFNPQNTIAKYGAIQTAHKKLLADGLHSEVLPEGQEFERVWELLGLPVATVVPIDEERRGTYV